MPKFLISLFRLVRDTLERPYLVLALCLLLAFSELVASGTLMSWWSLNRNLTDVRAAQQSHIAQLAQLKRDLKAAKDPAFLEREARERLNLVKENDLVFVFTEED